MFYFFEGHTTRKSFQD